MANEDGSDKTSQSGPGAVNPIPPSDPSAKPPGHPNQGNTERPPSPFEQSSLRLQRVLIGVTALYTFFSLLLWCSTRSSVDIARQAADSTKRSVEVAEKNFIASSRPWMKAKVSIVEPLAFTPNAPGKIRLRVVLENVGHSVALGVMSRSRVFAYTPGRIATAKAEWCDTLKDRSKSIEGAMVFPRDRLTVDEHTDITAEEISRGLAEKAIPGRIAMFLLTCIDYRFSFSEEHHQTHLVFFLGAPGGDGGAFMGYFSPEGTLSQLSLIPWLEGAYAD